MNWVSRSLIFLDVYCLTPYWHLTAWTLQTHESHGSRIFISIFTEMLFCSLLSVSCTLRQSGLRTVPALVYRLPSLVRGVSKYLVDSFIVYQLNELLKSCDSALIGGKIMGCVNNPEEGVMILRWPITRRNEVNISTVQCLSFGIMIKRVVYYSIEQKSKIFCRKSGEMAFWRLSLQKMEGE